MRTPEIERGKADGELAVVRRHIERWEDAHLVTHEQARALLEFETAGGTATPRRIPLIAEALGYLGAALTVSAAIALLAQLSWEDWSHVAHMVPFAAAAVLTGGAGALARGSIEPAIKRLAGVLWFLTVASAVAWMSVALFDRDVGDAGAEVLILGVASALLARVLHVLRPCVPLMAALFATTTTTVVGAMWLASDLGVTWFDVGVVRVGIALLLVSGLWIQTSATKALQPAASGFALGSLGAAFAPTLLIVDLEGLALGIGVAVTVLLVAGSVWLRSPWMLGIGVLALFGYVAGTIARYLSDTVGAPVALLLSGMLMVALAIVASRLRRFTR